MGVEVNNINFILQNNRLMLRYPRGILNRKRVAALMSKLFSLLYRMLFGTKLVKRKSDLVPNLIQKYHHKCYDKIEEKDVY